MSKKEEIGGRQYLERKDDHDGGVRPGFIFRVPGTVVKTNREQVRQIENISQFTQKPQVMFKPMSSSLLLRILVQLKEEEMILKRATLRMLRSHTGLNRALRFSR